MESIQQTCIGAFAGAVEVTCMQPTIAIKNALQERRPIPLSPSALYRGLTINISTMAPISAVQFGGVSAYTQLFITTIGRDPKGKEAVACAAAGGATSAIVAGPAELLVIQQQRERSTAMEAIRRVMGTYGFSGLYKGFMTTAIRDGLVVAGILGLCPAIVSELNEQESTMLWSKSAKTAIGATGAGIVGTVISMPFDAIKTRQQVLPSFHLSVGAVHLLYQAYLNKNLNPEYATIQSSFSKVWAEKGMLGIYSGTMPRGFRIVCAGFILNTVKDWADGMLATSGK